MKTKINQKLCLRGPLGSKKGEPQIQQGISQIRRDRDSERTERGEDSVKEFVMKGYNENRLRAKGSIFYLLCL